MAVILDLEFGHCRILQGGVANSNARVDIYRGLLFSKSTGRIGFVELVPEKRTSLSSVGPNGRPSITFIDTSRSQRGEGRQ